MSEFISALRYQQVTISSLDGKKKIDITNSILGIHYYEDILSPCITMTIDVTNANSIFNGLPIRGGESVAMEIETGNGTFKLDGEKALYVYKVSNIDAERRRESFTLHLTSREGLTNDTSRCEKKYKKASIDTHVRDILKNTLSTKKIGVIENTSNTYTFIGNNKKPFHLLMWLGPKSISTISGVSGVSGKNETAVAKGTAGFLFYENYDGFNFRSIDSLVSNTQLSSSDKKSSYKYRQTPIGEITANDPNNNFKILNFSFDKNIDLMKSLRVGMYSNKTYFYDLYTNTLDIYKYTLKDEIKKSTKLGAAESIVVSEEFGDSISRILFRTSDTGVLESTGKITPSGRDNADLAKSFSRYNLLFTQSLNISIPCNIKLKVGDIIYCEFQQMQAGQPNQVDPEQSGNYLIAALHHQFAPGGSKMLTFLKLIRDSYGLYGPNQ